MPEKKTEKIKVRVKPEIVKAGGGFHDFQSGADLYPKKASQIFEVEKTPFVRRKLASGELIIATGKATDDNDDDDQDKGKTDDKGKAHK